jgi:muramoyltetrapeptide carboxypeptidase
LATHARHLKTVAYKKMNRRNFSRLLIAAPAMAVSLSGLSTPASAVALRTQSLIKPSRLKTGDLVGLIAPGGVVDDALIEKCVKNLEAFGMRVKVSANIRAARGGYAGTVAQRVDDLHAMFLDKEVKAIWAARGGSGCIRLLPEINYSLIRNHPKILVGYSDITALLLAIYRHAGLVTFHGPVASSTFSDYSVAHLKAVLMEPQPRFEINMYTQNAEKAQQEPQFARRTIREGAATGRLVGGNLSVLSALIGTPYAVELRDSLLFLEEISEAPYRIDRMLTQLSQSGGLKNIAGAMLGVFQKSVVTDGEPSLTLNEVLDDHFAQLKTPSVYGFSFGHIAQQFTIPVGVRARLDTTNATLTLLESVVM